MKSLVRVVTLASVLVLAACNLPTGQANPSLSAKDKAATIVAATLQAVVSTQAPQMTPFASPAATEVSPTAKPTVLVSTNNSNCRSGPGANDKVLAKFAAGTVVALVGKDSTDNFWIVVDPASHNLCWMAGQDGTPSVDVALVPEVTPSASTTPAAGVPAGPTSLFYTFTCEGGGQVKVDLKWTDTATNETGYYVYRNGSQIASLPPNSTSYSDTTTVASGSAIVYQVAAYNDVGTSAQAVTGHGDPISC